MHASFIYPDRPLRVYWETTRACDLACRHCRADAAPDADPSELSTAEGTALLEQIASFGEPLPHLVLTGGDPLKRGDLFHLIATAREMGLRVSVAPSATPLLTADAIRRLHAAGVDAISLSLDGAHARTHDAIRGIAGTYERTIDAARVARDVGLPFQVNTLVCADTVDELPGIYDAVRAAGASRWSLFFLITVGRGDVLQPVSAERAEQVLHWVAALPRPGRGAGPMVTTTEAPQLRRVTATIRATDTHAAHHGGGIRDGNGILFVSHTGDICPSGFLEVPTGNVRRDGLVATYRHAPLFRSLRQPETFGGRCGVCPYQLECGGSRARAWAATGDPLAEDPLCRYEPPIVGAYVTR